MIISHKFQFIFVKTGKTAGTSIEIYLSQYCDQNDIITPIWPEDKRHLPRNYKGFFNPLPEIISGNSTNAIKALKESLKRRKYYNHIPANIIRERTSKKIWTNYFKFCVERNPWDKTLSHFYMVKSRSNIELSFDEYISRGRFCINYHLYTEKNGCDIIVDRVVKYENLEEELGDIFASLEIPFDGKLNIHAKADYRLERKPYQKFFSAKNKNIIAKAFEKEIQMHGYTFE